METDAFSIKGNKWGAPRHKHMFRINQRTAYFFKFRCACGWVVWVDRFAMRRATVSKRKTMEKDLLYRMYEESNDY